MLDLIIILACLYLLTLIIRSYSKRKKNRKVNRNSLIERFRKNFTGKNRLKERYQSELSNSLMASPDINIDIGIWVGEEDLREKADIHRTRLKKYGRSKMNGEMIFMGPKGGIYKYNSEGKKKYI